MIQAVLIFVFLFCGRILCFSQDVITFENENITFELRDNLFIVNGIYYFNSHSKKQYSILYPFPCDSIYGKPFNIQVECINSGEPLTFEVGADSSCIVFPIWVEGETPVLISYFQQLKSSKAKYILMTTNKWEYPLQHVDYKLITEQDVEIAKFSIAPDKEIILDNKKIYFWQKENFLPTVDFEIEF